MLNQFYHRVSSAALLTLMLMMYYHLETIGDRSPSPQLNSWIDHQLSFLWAKSEKAMKLLKDNSNLNFYTCSETSIK